MYRGVNIRFDDTSNIANVFTGKGVLAYSREIEEQMAKGKAKLEFDRCALFDTNLLSDLPKYFSGEPFDDPEHPVRIGNVLKFIDKELGRSFSFSFAALENLLEARKADNPHPLRKVAAVKADDKHGVSAKFEDVEKFFVKAKEFWLSMLTNEAAWNELHRRDIVYCVLIKAQLLRWSNTPLNEGVLELIKLSLGCFGKIAFKEIYFGWKLLRGNADATKQMMIFKETDLNNPTKKSIQRISALAWDLFMFRHFETLLTQYKGSKFFIPVITTFDTRLLQAIELCPLRALIIDDEASQVVTVFDDELEFQECLNDAVKNHAEIEERIRNPQLQRQIAPNFVKVSQMIVELEELVMKRTRAI